MDFWIRRGDIWVRCSASGEKMAEAWDKKPQSKFDRTIWAEHSGGFSPLNTRRAKRWMNKCTLSDKYGCEALKLSCGCPEDGPARSNQAQKNSPPPFLLWKDRRAPAFGYLDSQRGCVSLFNFVLRDLSSRNRDANMRTQKYLAMPLSSDQVWIVIFCLHFFVQKRGILMLFCLIF